MISSSVIDDALGKPKSPLETTSMLWYSGPKNLGSPGYLELCLNVKSSIVCAVWMLAFSVGVY